MIATDLNRTAAESCRSVRIWVDSPDVLESANDDSQGRPSLMTLYQNGRQTSAKRLDDTVFQKLVDAEAVFQKRFKDQTAAPGTEAAVRRTVEEIRSGKPNYDLMSPGMAAATRQQLSQMQSGLQERGAMQSVTFKGVGPGGADIYEIKFEKGA